MSAREIAVGDGNVPAPPTGEAGADPASPVGPERPSPAVVLGGHALYMMLHHTYTANIFWMMPLLVRLHFGDERSSVRDWQTMLVTAAIPTFMMSSIFWAELLRRITLRRYLLIYWLASPVVFGAVAYAQSYWHLLVCQIIGAVGLAGFMPLNSKLLKHFYSDAIRGRAYAVMNGAGLISSVGTVYLVGGWLEQNPGAFRVYFPTIGLIQLLGLTLLGRLARLTGTTDELTDEPQRGWGRLVRPVLNMGSVLRRDRTFLWYEIAFMTYGAAFMFCDALLPVLATDRLGMGYGDYAHSTQMISRLAMFAVSLPAGWLLDRFGPMRTSGLSFSILAAYPLMLLLADGPMDIALACALWGSGLGGVMMGWMLGPVTLARRKEDVPTYSGIHATLVGVRGLLFQGLGMGLYQLSGMFTLPLLLASALFITAAAMMWSLRTRMRARVAEDGGG